MIETKKRFVLKKEKIYPLSRKERKEVYDLSKNNLKKSILGPQNHYK